MSLKRKFFIIAFWSLFLVGIVTVFGFFFLISEGKLGYMPTFEELENPNNKFASEVYFEDGPIISRYYQGSENRRYTEYREIPLTVIQALVATEDVRFFTHSGIDLKGLFRVLKGLVSMDVSSSGGGSTISQQLAKMLFPREQNQSGLQFAIRKFREWVIAVRLERSYTKEEILTMYLNKFDFLNLAVGINSAAEIYFQQPVETLTIPQAAMLVGMAKNPSLFNPLKRPEETQIRRNVVLHQMLKYDVISRATYDSLKVKPLGLKFKKEDHKEGLATYFREYLRIYMTATRPNKANYRGWNYETYIQDSIAWLTDPLYGWCNKNKSASGDNYDIYADGLKIYTTLNSHMQRYAEEASVEHLSQVLQPLFNSEAKAKRNPPFSNDLTNEEVDDIIERAIKRTERYKNMNGSQMPYKQVLAEFKKRVPMKLFTLSGIRDTVMSPLDSLKYYKSFFHAGLMAMDPRNGHVKAYVGGQDYRYFMYDMVSVGKRQVGSTIKPILYTLAMQEGLSPCEKVPNIPQTFVLGNGERWTPKGGTSRVGEMVTLRWGLANSENNISAWVLKQFTPQAVAQMARKMGISSHVDPVPSICLGTAEITVKEMVAAYSVFANKGVHNTPILVSRIEDRYGNVLAEFKSSYREVITAQTAYLMTNLLEAVVKEGTGGRLRWRFGVNIPSGGKTGTTQSHSDGWFMSVTPELVGGVWVGAEDRAVHFQTIENGQGASMALPVWAKFMQRVLKDPSLPFSYGPFEKPPGMKVKLDCQSASEKDYSDDEKFY
ncbi:penicillin-binding protein 1A [Bacteroidia bacterium]|nr:penicillin-binding protein 1A [Bacteroidia bacterium]